MKKTFLYSVLISQLLFAACGDSKPRQESADISIETDKVINSDAQNNSLKGKVRKVVTINYSDVVVVDGKMTKGRFLDSIITEYNDRGFILSETGYSQDGKKVSSTTYTVQEDGSGQLKTYNDDKLYSEGVIKRKEKIVEKEVKLIESGKVFHTGLLLDDKYRVASIEAKEFDGKGSLTVSGNTEMIYDGDGNKKLLKHNMNVTGKGSLSFDNNITTYEKDEYANPLNIYTVSKSSMGELSQYIIYSYEYYE